MMLSFNQHGFLNVNQVSLHLNNSYLRVLKVEKQPDLLLWKASVMLLVDRHPALSRVISINEGEKTLSLPSEEIKLQIANIKFLSTRKRLPEVLPILEDYSRRCFASFETPLFKVGLIQVEGSGVLLVFAIHQALADQFSINIIIQELKAHYCALDGTSITTLKSPLHFDRFAEWQHSLFEKSVDQMTFYWRNKLKGITYQSIFFENKKFNQQFASNRKTSFQLPKATKTSLEDFANQYSFAIPTILMSAFLALTRKYRSQDDLVILTCFENRDDEALKSIIGPLENRVILRVSATDDDSFLDLVKMLAHEQGESDAYKYLPFERLKTIPDLQLFDELPCDIFFRYEKQTEAQNDYSEIIDALNWGCCNINFSFNHTQESLKGTAVFNDSICSNIFIEDFISNFIEYIGECLAQPTSALSNISYYKQESEQKIVENYLPICSYYHSDKTLHELFELQVIKDPHAIALISDGRKLSYQELDERSNQLAHYLLEKYTIKQNQLIGLLLERNEYMIISILAVLKAGGGYVPIDPEYPQERIDFILKDAKIELLITHGNYTSSNLACTVMPIDIREIVIKAYIKTPLLRKTNSSDLAYVIYTSGTTGLPKGVLIEHSNVIQLLFPKKPLFKFSSHDVWTMFHSYCFDISVWELFGCLLTGGRLVMVPRAIARDAYAFSSLLQNEHVTVLNQTPSAFKNILAAVREQMHLDLCVRYVIFGGEALQFSSLKYWKEYYPETHLINMYGITETTVHNTFKEISEEDIAEGRDNIGVPLPTLSAFVLNNKRQLIPPGGIGELYIGGAGLSRGYLNRPELTEERFISNPFVKNERLYKSGDLVQLLFDGTLRYIGRIDKQVKIRGYRVELSEIEQILVKHKNIENAIVVAREDLNSNKSLIAYIIGHIEVQEVRLFVSQYLPEYMLPSYYVYVDQFPLTKNGKIDYNALPSIDESANNAEYIPAHTSMQSEILRVWQQFINKKQISIRDNFFDIGGNSLNATQLISYIHKITGVKLTLVNIFTHATIEDQAELIITSAQERYSAITPAEKKDYYELSSAQKRLYFLHQFNPESLAYNMPAIFRLNGVIDTLRLETSFQQLVDRHESLRTSFISFEGQPYQQIQAVLNFQIEYFQEEIALEELIQAFIRPFDLEESPLLRVGLVQEANNRSQHLLLIDMHHIISDWQSIQLLIKDLFAIYNGEKLSLTELSYKDYAEWQYKDKGHKQLLQAQKQYWLDKFSTPLSILNLPTDYIRPASKNYKGNTYSFSLSQEETVSLKNIAAKERVTIFMVFLALYNVMLSRLTGQEDIVIGTPTSGRTHIDTEQIIGMFVNTLPLRNQVIAEQSFDNFLQQIRLETLNAFDNQDFQYEDLLEELALNREIGRNPLFDVLLVVQNQTLDNFLTPNVSIDTIPFEEEIAKFDLTLYCKEVSGEFKFFFEYSTQLFNSNRIAKFATCFKNIITSVIQDSSRSLCELDILTENEKQELLFLCNDVPEGFLDKNIIDILQDQVAKHPNKIALVSGDISLTYRELDERSNQLANFLRENYSLESEKLIGLIFDRNEYMVLAILGVLKSGNAYVPIAFDYPHERVNFIVKDAELSLLLTCNEYKYPLGNATILNILEREQDISKSSITLPTLIIPTDHLAYVIYTSGTTGNPKGVLVEHRNVVQLLFPNTPLFDFDSNDVWSLFHSYSFDVSVWEIFGCLLNGGRLVVVPFAIAQDSYAFASLLLAEQITVLCQTPSAFKNLQTTIKDNDNLPDFQVRFIIFAGEALQFSILNYWKSNYPDCRLINMYGITETTVHNTFKEVMMEEIVREQDSIGKMLPTLTAYVLDKHKQLVPIGVTGELYVGGAGVTRGYLNRPELNAERFIANPFGKSGRLYKSGDLVQLQIDGSLLYLGRADNQVKIRGYRVELKEIEKVLEWHEYIHTAIVVAKDDPQGSKFLVAYVIANENLVPAQIRNYLLKQLPPYMVPGYYNLIDKWPLTKNGKIDIKALLNIDNLSHAPNYTPTTDNMQIEVTKVWQQLLKRDKISITENFFEIGGHSLSAIQLVVRLHGITGVKLELRDVFTHNTIEGQAALIKASEQDKYSSINPAGKKEYYTSSSAQRRLYVLHKLNEASLAYNMTSVFIIEGYLTIEKLEKVFTKLIQRHESLRTSFVSKNGELIQYINTVKDFSIEVYEEISSIDVTLEKFIRPFTLEESPLIRVGLIQQDATHHMLLVDMHHIIADGLSIKILINDFINIYQGLKLPALSIQYKDYADWQTNDAAYKELVNQQRNYWLKKFNDPVDALNLPTTYVRPTFKSYKGESYAFDLSKKETDLLNKLATEQGVTTFMLFMAIYNVLLYRLTNQKNIVIGTPSASRNHPDIEEVIGMFANTLPIRTAISPLLSFTSFLKQVKEDTIAAFSNQDYQYEDLLEDLAITRDISRNPLFDVMLVVQHQVNDKLIIPDLKIGAFDFESHISKFDLMLDCSIVEDVYKLEFEYSADLFDRDTIINFSHYLRQIINSIINDSGQILANLEFLPQVEKVSLLQLFANNPIGFSPSTLHEKFTEQAIKYPDHTAVVSGDVNLTYRELEEKSNKLANYLKENYIFEREQLIGLLLNRSELQVIAVLGILKSGAAYVPIDPTSPLDRIEFIVEDASLKLIITDLEFPSVKIDTLHLNKQFEYINQCSSRPTIVNVDPKDLAYVIYTSGTTGRPKGVLVEHRNVMQLLYPTQPCFSFGPNDVWTLFHSYSFDFSVWEIFGCLLHGGKLIVVPFIIAQDSVALAQLLHYEGVTVLSQTPSAFRNLQTAVLEQPDLDLIVNYLFFGGEALLPSSLHYWKSRYPTCQIINMYGITETTIVNTYKKICEKDIELGAESIGKPFATVRAYVLNEERQLVARGGTGELYLGGACVSRGYLNRPTLTTERFINNPFVQGERLYKSGDLVKLNQDGSMSFIGRIDKQVKIRGYRVELSEIEHVLDSSSLISSSLVLAQEDNQSNKYLVAYLVGAKEDAGIIRDYLLNQLPIYMVPTHYILLEKWPLTRNGKINYSALPNVENSYTSLDYAPVNTDLHSKILEIWHGLLNYKNIGIRDDFFAIGGHSLSATRLIAQLHKTTGVHLELRDVFIHTTIQQQAELIEATVKKSHTSISPATKKDYYHLSSAQKRLFILHELDKRSIAYNVPAVFEFKKPIDHLKLVKIFNLLIERHEVLRTHFVKVDGQPMQRVDQAKEFHLESFQDGIPIQDVMAEFVRPFDLGISPLFRVSINEHATGKQYLLFDIHHIISDGVSVEVLMSDFVKLYEEQVLPPLVLQYKDYSEWQTVNLQNGLYSDQEAYWLNEYAKEISPVNLPYDYPRPKLRGSLGQSINFYLEENISATIREYCRNYEVTYYMLFLAVYNILISKLSTQQEIIVGTPVSGRRHSDLENVVGVFINMLGIKTTISNDVLFKDYLQQVKEKVITALDHEEYPFEELVQKLQATRNLGRNPLFDVSFSFQMSSGENQEWPFDTIEFDSGISKYDLLLVGGISGERITFTMQYDTQLFKPSTIDAYITYLKRIVSHVLKEGDILLKDIQLLSEEEEYLLFQDSKDIVLYNSTQNIQSEFELQVAQFPNHIALVYETEKMTYLDLNKKANQVARHLIHHGVPKGSAVALLIERSFEMVIAILGALKAGCAYLPIAPDLPQKRIDMILKDAVVDTILTTFRYKEEGSFAVNKIIDIAEASRNQYSTENLLIACSPNDLAYIIYTSGTTGTPCGIMIEHQSILNTLNWRKAYYRFDEHSTVLQIPSYSFDSSVEDIFSMLLAGGKLILINPKKRLDIPHLKQLIARHQVNHMLVVPQFYKEFLENNTTYNLSSVTSITLAGDSFSENLVREHFSLMPGVELYNEYGPTENSVCSSIYKFDSGNIILSIGKPIPNVLWHVIDEQMRHCVLGVPGELYLEGKGLARGYINKMDSSMFTINPYTGERMYATGDRVVQLADGNVKFLGRIDQEIKIRGNRIDILEIESFLKSFNYVSDAVVLHNNGNNGPEFLSAYLKTNNELDIRVVKEQMAAHFPSYMIPEQYFVIDEIPLNVNGKVDRSHLMVNAKLLTATRQHVPPTTEIQYSLSEAWKYILGLDEVGIHDNFFDLGGNSLKAIQLSSVIEEKINREFPVLLLFEYPSISELSDYLQRDESDHQRVDEIMRESIETLEDSIDLFNEE